jgi:DNA-binding TFAR19-related protein (PDSD5 family)
MDDPVIKRLELISLNHPELSQDIAAAILLIKTQKIKIDSHDTSFHDILSGLVEAAEQINHITV